MKFLAQRYVLPVLLLLLTWAILIPVLFLPAFGSDGRWLAAPPQNLNLAEALSSFRWAEPPLLEPLMRGLQAVLGDNAVPIWRMAALALHFVTTLMLARVHGLAHPTLRSANKLAMPWTLALALTVPILFRWLTALPALFTQIAVLSALLALFAWFKHRRESAFTLALLAFLLVSTHTAQAKALFALFCYYATGLIAAFGLGAAFGRWRTSATRIWATRVGGIGLIAFGLFINSQMLDTYARATSIWDALLRTRAIHALVINAPTAIGTAGESSLLYGDDALIVSQAVAERKALAHWPISATLAFGVIADGRPLSATNLGGKALSYAGQTPLSHAEALAHVRQADAVFVGIRMRQPDGQFEATRLVGGFGPTPPTNSSTPYLARFESGDNRVVLTALEMCAPNGLKLTLRIERGPGPTVKLFRHALRGTDQLTGNDDGLIGGLIELAELHPSDTLQDISYFAEAGNRADGVRVGLYDWQTGQRWLALHPDGAQWAENAVAVARPATIAACGS